MLLNRIRGLEELLAKSVTIDGAQSQECHNGEVAFLRESRSIVIATVHDKHLVLDIPSNLDRLAHLM